MKYEAIFRPIKIGPVTLKNRIEVAPAAPFLTGHDSSVTPEIYAHTMDLAASGAAVVMLGVTAVDRKLSDGLGGRILSAGDDMYLSDLNTIAEGMHREGAAAGVELVHQRFMLTPPEIVVGQTSTEEVEEIIRLFADAARRCMLAGFDMILIHGGHGNVPSMFFNKKFNHRTDRFGGSFENRCRFGKELLTTVRESTEGRVAIEYRISAEEMKEGMTTFGETLDYAEQIQDLIDLLHVSRGLLEENSLVPYINAPSYLPRALNLPFAKKFKERLHIPVSVVGSFDLETAERAVAAGDVDMVSMIRTIMADTRCVKKAERGEEDTIRPCLRCNSCIDRTHSRFLEVRCAVNPLIGRQTRTDYPRRAEQSRRVLIAGGGPAGMEAARVASRRGHRVTLVEKEDRLGGNLILASAGTLKQELREYLDWSVRMIERDENIEVRTGTPLSKELLEEISPDALIIAAGSDPILPAFTASGTEKAIWVGDAEGKGPAGGEHLVIAGAGLTGLEYALEQLQSGKKITIIDQIPREQIGRDGCQINLHYLEDALLSKCDVRCGVTLKDVTDKGALIADSEGKEEWIECDQVVLSFGFRPKSALYEEYRGLLKDVSVIGDCSGHGGNILKAVRSGFDAAMAL